jgi:hypothetical protein
MSGSLDRTRPLPQQRPRIVSVFRTLTCRPTKSRGKSQTESRSDSQKANETNQR